MAHRTRYFVECSTFSNKRLGPFLTEHSIGDEAKFIGFLDTQGKPHDVWEIPARFIKNLVDAMQDEERHRFRFFTITSDDSRLSPADFFAHRKPAKKVQQARADLERLTAGQSPRRGGYLGRKRIRKG